MRSAPDASASRRHSLILPREHGAWGILLVPLVTGASVGLLAGGTAGALAPLTIAVLALFWMRTPLESWMGTTPVKARTSEEVALVRRATLIIGAVAAAALIWLLWGWRNSGLWEIGAAAVAAFLLQTLIRRQWRGWRTAAQMAGAAGLTAVAPAAYYAVAGRLDTAAWSLWAANFFFAGDQIEFVQLRIRAAHASHTRKLSAGREFLIRQIVLAALLILASASGLLRWGAALAFVPILVRGFAWFATKPKPLAIHALGKSELTHAIAFGILLIIGYQV